MSHGLEYKCIGGKTYTQHSLIIWYLPCVLTGSPTALMQLSIEHKMFSPGFFRESLGKVMKLTKWGSIPRLPSCCSAVQRMV